MNRHRIPNDATRVDVHHDEEVHYWREQFDCTPAQLREAVSSVGQDAGNVRQHLSQPTV